MKLLFMCHLDTFTAPAPRSFQFPPLQWRRATWERENKDVPNPARVVFSHPSLPRTSTPSHVNLVHTNETHTPNALNTPHTHTYKIHTHIYSYAHMPSFSDYFYDSFFKFSRIAFTPTPTPTPLYTCRNCNHAWMTCLCKLCLISLESWHSLRILSRFTSPKWLLENPF